MAHTVLLPLSHSSGKTSHSALITYQIALENSLILPSSANGVCQILILLWAIGNLWNSAGIVKKNKFYMLFVSGFVNLRNSIYPIREG